MQSRPETFAELCDQYKQFTSDQVTDILTAKVTEMLDLVTVISHKKCEEHKDFAMPKVLASEAMLILGIVGSLSTKHIMATAATLKEMGAEGML